MQPDIDYYNDDLSDNDGYVSNGKHSGQHEPVQPMISRFIYLKVLHIIFDFRFDFVLILNVNILRRLLIAYI